MQQAEFVIAWASASPSLALRRADRNASAATVVTLNQSFADGWRMFQDAGSEDRRDFEFAELMNTFEIAAAIHQEGSLHGVARSLIANYLCAALKVIDEDEDARRRVGLLRDAADTFEHLVDFIKAMKSKADGITLLPTMQIAD